MRARVRSVITWTTGRRRCLRRCAQLHNSQSTRLSSMCNRYHPTRADIIHAQWDFGELPTGDKSWRPGIGPFGTGPFIRIRETEPELVVGTWALIGDKDKKPSNAPRMTNCARSEELTEKKTYAGLAADNYLERRVASRRNVTRRVVVVPGAF